VKEVNANLYEFLNNHEIHVQVVNDKIETYMFIPFYDLDDFKGAIGTWPVDDGGVDCKLQDGCICIDVVDLIEYQGHLVSSYSNCFEKDEWDQYKERILELEIN